MPYFVVPSQDNSMDFEFSLTVQDGEASASDTVAVHVPEPEPLVVDLQVSAGPNSPAAAVYQPFARHVPGLQLRLEAAGQEPVRVDALRIGLEVRGHAGSLPGARLILDADGDGQSGDADTLLTVLDGPLSDNLLFSGLDLEVTAAAPRFLLVELNLPGPAASAGMAPFGWLAVLGVLLFLPAARQRRLVAMALLLALAVACQRIGFENWQAEVSVGLTENQALTASPLDSDEPAQVTGAPVLGPTLTVTSTFQEP
jgi:hypothetical protein